MNQVTGQQVTQPLHFEVERMIYQVMLTESWFVDLYTRKLRDFGISYQQYCILRILKGKYRYGYLIKELSAKMPDRNSNVTRLVDKLAEKKLAIRSGNSLDKRLVNIRITDAGMELLERFETTPSPDTDNMRAFDPEIARYIANKLKELRGEVIV